MASTSATFQDVFSITSNQAGIAFLENTSIGLLAEQRFLNADIQQFGVVAGSPTRFGSFGLLIQTFGFEVLKAAITDCASRTSIADAAEGTPPLCGESNHTEPSSVKAPPTFLQALPWLVNHALTRFSVFPPLVPHRL